MRQRHLRFLPVVAILLLFAGGDAAAAGFGIYGNYGQGTVSAKRDSDAGRYEFDQDGSHAGIGLLYETNVLEDRPFSWRASLGFEKTGLEVDGGDRAFADGLDSDYKGRLVVGNEFVWGRKASPRVRYWGGAATRLSLQTGQDGDYVGPRDQKVFGVSLGPVVGVNLGIGESTALSLSGGYLLSAYSGRWTDWTGPSNRRDMTATEGGWFLGAALLVKTGDISWDEDADEKDTLDGGAGSF